MDENWKLARRAGIGGSDVSAILGMSPWKSAMEVWLDKKGLLDDVSNPNREFLMQLGTDLEPVIARLYERQTGKKLSLPFPMQWKHKQHEILIGTPDRFVEGQAQGVELKSESKFSDRFGDPFTDQVPPHYLLQVAHYINVLDYESWDIALLHAGTTFAIYTVRRDKELEDAVTEQILGWWERHIVKDTPPDVDGSEGWSKYLKKKFPANIQTFKVADEETTKLVEQLKIIRLGRDFYENKESDLENRIKFAIGEHDGITGPFGKVSWKKTKDSEKVDWELAYRDVLRLVAPCLPAEMLAQVGTIQNIHTMPRQGVRRFLLTEPKGNYGDRDSKKPRDLPAATGEVQAGDRPSITETSER